MARFGVFASGGVWTAWLTRLRTTRRWRSGTCGVRAARVVGVGRGRAGRDRAATLGAGDGDDCVRAVCVAGRRGADVLGSGSWAVHAASVATAVLAGASLIAAGALVCARAVAIFVSLFGGVPCLSRGVLAARGRLAGAVRSLTVLGDESLLAVGKRSRSVGGDVRAACGVVCRRAVVLLAGVALSADVFLLASSLAIRSESPGAIGSAANGVAANHEPATASNASTTARRDGNASDVIVCFTCGIVAILARDRHPLAEWANLSQRAGSDRAPCAARPTRP